MPTGRVEFRMRDKKGYFVISALWYYSYGLFIIQRSEKGFILPENTQLNTCHSHPIS